MNELTRIIVRRPAARAKRHHHGGSWKIAYADFMTAMMALFLVMWFLSATRHDDLIGLSTLFPMPLTLAEHSGPKTSNASTVIPGGGTDTSRQDGETHRGTGSEGLRVLSAAERAEAAQLMALEHALEALIESSPALRKLSGQLSVDMTIEGLRVQVVDSRNRPMFESGRAVVLPHMRELLREIAPVLSRLPNRIAIAGHTDNLRYAGRGSGYSNWELSADRANASRRELVASGLQPEKVLRVVGLADTQDLNAADPADPVNRRISVIVLTREAQRNIEREGLAFAAAHPLQPTLADTPPQTP